MYNSSISIALVEISIYRKNECSKKWKEKCKRGFFIVRNLAKDILWRNYFLNNTL